MKLPKTYKGLLSILIEIAENGNEYKGNLDESYQMDIGECIANIQNWLGENEELLVKMKLKYNS